MNQIFSIKSAAVLCVATLMMCFSAQDASAQCRGGGGFGGGYGYGGGYSGRSIGYSSGYRGVNVNRFGGFGPSVSVSVGRSGFGNSFSRGGNFSGSGFYGNYRSPYSSRSRFGY